MIAPKFDEALPMGSVFGIDMGEAADLQIDDHYATWLFDLSDRACALVVMNEQGSLDTQQATSAILRRAAPHLICLVGTALGRQGSVVHADVVLASQVIDATEGFPGEIRPDHFRPSRAVLQDLARFEATGFGSDVRAELEALCPDGQEDSLPDGPNIRVEPLAVVPKVVKSESEQEALWRLHPKLCAADMESAGFRAAVEASQTGHWVIVRGVSDFGSDKSGQEKRRNIAALAAGIALKVFLTSSLHEVDAERGRVLETVCCFFPGCDVKSAGMVDGESYSLLYPFVTLTEPRRGALLCDLHHQHATRMQMQDNPGTLELWASSAAGPVGSTRHTFIQDILGDSIESGLTQSSTIDRRQ